VLLPAGPLSPSHTEAEDAWPPRVVRSGGRRTSATEPGREHFLNLTGNDTVDRCGRFLR
jgi:hypothetical protein